MATLKMGTTTVLTDTTLANAVQDNVTRLGTVTTGNISNSAIVYPAGHITNAWNNHFAPDPYQLPTNTGTKAVGFDAFSWPTITGRKYFISSIVSARPVKESGSSSGLTMEVYAYYGITDRSAGDTSFDTKMSQMAVGRNLIAANSSSGAHGYHQWGMHGSFTAGSTTPHYFYIAFQGSAGVNARLYAVDTSPWQTLIYEVMP